MDAAGDNSSLDSESGGDGTHLPLTVHLLIPDATIADLTELADEDYSVGWYRVEQELGELQPIDEPSPDDPALQIAIRSARRRAPTWKPFLRDLGVPVNADAEGDSASVLIVVQATGSKSTRWVAFCFGGISRSLPANLVDGRFGIIATLNRYALGEDHPSWRELPPSSPKRALHRDPTQRVRAVSAEVRDGVHHRMDARADMPSPLQGLRVDTASDLLRSLRVRTVDPLMRDLDGSRSLKFATYLESLSDFTKLGEYLVDLRDESAYVAEWSWIDHVVPVQTRIEADKLLRELTQRIGTPGEPAIDLLMPDWAEQNDHPSKRLRIAFPGERGEPRNVLVDWPQLRSWIIQNKTRDTKEPLLRSRLRADLEGGPTGATEQVTIAELVVAEFAVDGINYIVSDGQVCMVNSTYLERLNDELSTIPWSDYPFPAYEGENEPGYLAKIRKDPHSGLAVLDTTGVWLPGETSFEPCDLVTATGMPVFAKLKGRSSLFSHLCTQAESSLDLLTRSPEARSKFLDLTLEATSDQAVLDATQDLLGSIEAQDRRERRACLLLLGTWRDSAPDIRSLPLLSRLRLQKAFHAITQHGFTLELASPQRKRGRTR